MKTFNVVLLGDSGSGKTTFIRRCLTGNFRSKYKATMEVEFNSLIFYTSSEPIRFNVWEISGNISDISNSNHNEYILKSDAVIIFTDISQVNFDKINYLNSITDKIPVAHKVVCYNKVDLQHIEKPALNLCWQYIEELNIKQYYISAKNNYYLDKTWLYLTQKLLNNDNLRFIESPALTPPEVKISPIMQQGYKNMLKSSKSEEETPKSEEEPPREYHTIKSFYTYLKEQNPKYQVNLQPKFIFHKVEFHGLKTQTHQVVEESDDWNNLSILKIQNTPTKISNILNSLEKYLEKKGECTITITTRETGYTTLISTKTVPVCLDIISNSIKWYDTHLNTYQMKQDENKRKLQQELDKFRTIVDGDSKLCMRYLVSRLKEYQNIDVYIVGDKYYTGLEKLIEAYDYNGKSSLFRRSDLSNNIYQCIITEEEFIMMIKIIKTHNLSVY